jgi:hypothetical protein
MPSKKALQTITYDETIPLKFKVIDQDHPEIFWLVETLPTSGERIYFERQFKNETHQPRGLTKKGSSGIGYLEKLIAQTL